MRDTLLQVLCDRARRTPQAVALCELASGGATADRSVSWSAWLAQSRAVAGALAAAGVPAGSHVAILAGNSTVWPVADVGIQLAGCVSVGIYPSSSAVQIRDLLADCAAPVLIVEGADALSRAMTVRDALPALQTVVYASSDDTPTPHESATVRWGRWLADGAAMRASSGTLAAELIEREMAVAAESDAAIIYTSGSTGVPKGARLSHAYLLASAASVRDTLTLDETDRMLSYLPYAHAAERVFGLATRILCGIPAGLVRDHTKVWDAAREFEPTVFAGLPRFFEKLHDALLAAEAAGGVAFRQAMTLGAARAGHRRRGTPVPEELEREYEAARAPLDAWRAAWLGRSIRFATSGGAALPRAVAETLDAAGVSVLGAYGLTEHLCVAFHRPASYGFEGVGTPMPGTEIRIGGDGEVLVRRNALTFSGYLGRERETAEAFTADGEWLRTGDAGLIGPDGALRITGRFKELIALSAGKKVAPLPIEARLADDPLVAHAMCYGEGRRFLSALIVLRRDSLHRWAKESGLAAGAADLSNHPALLTRLQASVDRINADVSGPEQIRRFIVLGHELSEDAGELTPTHKLRRSVVAERYFDQLDALYRPAPPDQERG